MIYNKKKWQKIYWAITDAKPPETAATLHHYLVKQESLNKSFVCQPDTKGAKEALLKYRIRGMGTTLTCLEIELLTGRHHQIRVQLAHIGCTVRGDLKYGARRSALKGSIYLHARSLHLVHPVQKTPLIIEAPTPDDPVWNLFK